MLVALSTNTSVDLTELNALAQVRKTKISYIAIINLQIIQKLTYLLQRGVQLSAHIDIDLITAEIKYWREFVLFALTHTGEETLKYDHVHLMPNVNANEQRSRLSKKEAGNEKE